MAEKEGGLLFYPADLALAAVCTNNHQVADVNSPDYTEHIIALCFSLLSLEPQTLFYIPIDSISKSISKLVLKHSN